MRGEFFPLALSYEFGSLNASLSPICHTWVADYCPSDREQADKAAAKERYAKMHAAGKVRLLHFYPNFLSLTSDDTTDRRGSRRLGTSRRDPQAA